MPDETRSAAHPKGREEDRTNKSNYKQMISQSQPPGAPLSFLCTRFYPFIRTCMSSLSLSLSRFLSFSLFLFLSFFLFLSISLFLLWLLLPSVLWFISSFLSASSCSFFTQQNTQEPHTEKAWSLTLLARLATSPSRFVVYYYTTTERVGKWPK